jgi:diguanylate cyclase (GGDEF)-like protein/PAS domain S-box-containing protein
VTKKRRTRPTKRPTSGTPRRESKAPSPRSPVPREGRWLAQVAEALPGILWIAKRDRSRIVYVGPQCQKVYGIPSQTLKADPMAWIGAVHADDRARVASAMRRQGDKPVAMKYRVVRRGRDTRLVVHSSLPLQNSEGKYTHVVDLVADLGEGGGKVVLSKQKEYERIFFSSPDYVCVTDTDGRILDANPAFLECLGLSWEDLVHSNIETYYAEENRRRLLRVLRRLRRGEEIIGLEARVRTPRGRVLCVEVNAAPLKEGGAVDRFLLLGRDVTARSRVQEALTEKARQQEQLLETTRQLALTLDAKDVLTRIATRAKSILNARACVLYLLEADGRTLTPAVSTDAPHSDEVLSVPLDTERSMTGQAVKTRRGLIFNDAWTHPSGYQVPGTPEEKEERVIVVPLAVDDHALGAMCVNRLGESFTDQDLALAEAFGAYAATALRNAQSHEALLREAEVRKRAEQALAKEREYYRSFVESLTDWAWEMDAGGVHTYSNRAIEMILGYEVDQVVGQHVTTLWCEEDRTAENLEWLQRSLASGKGWQTFTARFRHKDGSARLLESTALPIRDAEGNLVGYRGLDHDITDRRRAEEELRASEEKYRGLVENTNDILYSLDPKGAVLYASPGVRIVGYSAEEMIGRNIMEFVPEQAVDAATESFRKAFAGKSDYFESPFRTKDGQLRWIRSRVQQVQEDGTVVGLQGVATDITELKITGQALEHARRKLVALHLIAQRLEACPSEDEICRIAVGAAEKILESSLCSCRLAEGERLVVKAASSRPTARMFWDNLVDEELAQRTYRTGETFLFSAKSQLPVRGAERRAIESGLSVPVGDLGVLQAFALEPQAFGADDARLAELLVGHVAQAVRRIRLENDLKEQALHDPLTGVYNRYYTNQILGREIKRSERMKRPIAFLMIDVNGLKDVNDRFGHQAGDRVLQATATLLQDEVRATDTIVRYGGDEFLAILLEAAEEAVVVARRIARRAPAIGVRAGLGAFPVTIAIGIASWDPAAPVPIEQVLREADDRMYEEKRKRSKKA